MAKADPTFPDVFTLAQVEKEGMTKFQAARRVRSGHWRRLGRGIYCLQSTWDSAHHSQRHLLLAQAACLGGPEGRCLSHASAAAWHDLPVPFGGTDVWVTGAPNEGTHYRAGIRVLAAPLPAEDFASYGGIRVTTIPRTVADCLRHLELADAISVGDAAVRRDLTLRRDIDRVFDRCAGWPFVERGRQLMGLLDGRRETALESASFVEMYRSRIPLPEPQVRIFDGSRIIARGDFWWKKYAVLGEADGLVKYGVGTDDDLTESRRALVKEKRREDRLRELGIHVVRWGFAELKKAGWAAWLRRELERGDPSRFRGRTASTPFR